MKVIKGAKKNTLKKPVGIGLGNFDGLHVGHLALINTLIDESKLHGLLSMVYTFTKHPENILRKKLFNRLLTNEEKKVALLSDTKLDALCFEEFDEDFSRLKPEEFVKNILVDKFNIKLAVAGFDYRFGYRGQGDVDTLRTLGEKYSFKVIIIPPIKVGEQVVSSTLIRQHVQKGNVGKVFKLLGRHYSVLAEVTSGRRIGNTLGFPTANIIAEEYLLIPKEGVYITKTLLEGKFYDSLTNIGNNPTFKDQTYTSVETHIIDFNEDIYGKKIEVFFLKRLRDEKAFDSKDDLVRQMKTDVLNAREFFYGK